MTPSRVVRRYAKALFALAREREIVDAISSDLERVSAIAADTPELIAVLRHPRISAQRKKELLARTVAETLNPVTRDLLFLMVDKHRADAAGSLHDHYTALVREWRRIMLVEVVTAVSLTDDEVQRMRTRLQTLTDCQLELTQTIDDSILGGIIIRFGGKVIDASIASQLRQIGEALKQVRVTGTRES